MPNDPKCGCVSCAMCSTDLPGTSKGEDGCDLYGDGDAIVCPNEECKATNHITVDEEYDDEGLYGTASVSYYTCKHGKDEDEFCGECDGIDN